MPGQFRCRCARFGQPCSGRMTQEDLLCGICRDGCWLIGFSAEGTEPETYLHAGVSEFTAEVAGTYFFATSVPASVAG